MQAGDLEGVVDGELDGLWITCIIYRLVEFGTSPGASYKSMNSKKMPENHLGSGKIQKKLNSFSDLSKSGSNIFWNVKICKMLWVFCLLWQHLVWRRISGLMAVGAYGESGCKSGGILHLALSNITNLNRLMKNKMACSERRWEVEVGGAGGSHCTIPSVSRLNLLAVNSWLVDFIRKSLRILFSLYCFCHYICTFAYTL